MTDLNWWQKIVLSLCGMVKVGKRKREGWSGPLMFYAFQCPDHGIVEDYLHGYRQVLRCPECIKTKNLMVEQ